MYQFIYHLLILYEILSLKNSIIAWNSCDHYMHSKSICIKSILWNENISNNKLSVIENNHFDLQ